MDSPPWSKSLSPAPGSSNLLRGFWCFLSSPECVGVCTGVVFSLLLTLWSCTCTTALWKAVWGQSIFSLNPRIILKGGVNTLDSYFRHWFQRRDWFFYDISYIFYIPLLLLAPLLAWPFFPISNLFPIFHCKRKNSSRKQLPWLTMIFFCPQALSSLWGWHAKSCAMPWAEGLHGSAQTWTCGVPVLHWVKPSDGSGRASATSAHKATRSGGGCSAVCLQRSLALNLREIFLQMACGWWRSSVDTDIHSQWRPV